VIEKEIILSIDFLTELEQKVDILIKNHEQLREENGKLKEELSNKGKNTETLAEENQALKTEIETLRSGVAEKENKLNLVADKIRVVMSKIEAA
jgi:seryl-tRNA synthetase